MFGQENISLFLECLNHLQHEYPVRSMRAYPQHIGGVSCYDHCLLVSYLSFVFCKALKLDYRAAARGGLLHDLYLQDWKETNIHRFRRLFVHPHMALENAMHYKLSKKEQEIIVKHMWPLTPPKPPRYLETYIVGLADKIAASIEMLHLYRVLGLDKKMCFICGARCRHSVQ